MEARMAWRGVTEFEAALTHMVGQSDLEARAAVAEGGALIEKNAKEQASGRPGPNVQTGDLRRSITSSPVERHGIGWRVTVGPTVVYGRRVELGFTGIDSRGRRYSQPAYPYFEPGFRQASDHLSDIFARHWGAALTHL